MSDLIRTLVGSATRLARPAAWLWARSGYFSPRVPATAPRRLAILACNWIGDTFWVTQIVPYLKEKWPQAEVYVLTKGFSVDLWNGLVPRDHILVTPEITSDRRREQASWKKLTRRAAELRPMGFDVVLDMTFNRYSAVFAFLLRPAWCLGADGNELGWLYSLRSVGTWPEDRHLSERPFEVIQPLLGRYAYPPALVPPIPTRNFQDVCRDLDLDAGVPVVVLAPGAGWKAKEWPPEDFAVLARLLAQQGIQVVVTGSPSQAELCRQILQGVSGARTAAMVGRPLGEVFGLLSGARAVVGNESGLPHIAGAMDCRTITIFTKSGTPLWGTPRGRNVITFDLRQDPSLPASRVAQAVLKPAGS